MRPPTNMTAIIDRKRYSTATATLLCGDDWWDGHNHERHGRQQFLYRTPKGALFVVALTQWQGEADCIIPITEDDAQAFFETCAEQNGARVSFEEAFPGVEIEEA